MSDQVTLSGFANYPVIATQMYRPTSATDLRNIILSNEQVIARGNGMSYGDASLGPSVISTLGFSDILYFDAENGIIECQSGALLADILRLTIPKGWFFHVTPGIKFITVGGAIASDVHGKNHPQAGCFSDWLISFELMDSQGNVIACSKEHNSELFWLTCGGMGWTGVILSAKFHLKRIHSVTMQQKTVRCADIESLFATFDQNAGFSYAAGWIDTTSGGKGFGRGAVHFGEHETDPENLNWQVKTPLGIPFYAPSILMNPLSIRAFNAYYYFKNSTKTISSHIDSFFYPLDALRYWNRLYGRRGLVQYQFCIPEKHAPTGIGAVMDTIRKSSDKPFLSVLKKHGERRPEAINSFPVRGYSLALDFPRTRSLPQLISRLDDIVWKYDGKIYLTKDSSSRAGMGRVDLKRFGDSKFWSGLRARHTI